MSSMKIRVAFFLLTLLFGKGLCYHYREIVLPKGTSGPECIAFDFQGNGPYTGVSDGRVIKWNPMINAWTDFSIPSKDSLKTCNGHHDPAKEEICGRPLGLRFSSKTGDLYIADASYGLLVVGPNGGLARQVATEADGMEFKFTNGLDIDQDTGMVYFTDSSAKFRRRKHETIVLTGDSTGRLIRYDPNTNEVIVLLQNLVYPSGVALSKHNKFLLITQTTNGIILKLWLKGHKAGRVEEFARVPGYPDNIKINSKGEFWVAVSNARVATWEISAPLTKFQNPTLNEMVVGILYDEDGNVIEVAGNEGGVIGSVSDVGDTNGTFYIGSIVSPYVVIYHP